MKYRNIREEDIKNKVAKDYFWLYDCSNIIGNIDFSVVMPHSNNKGMNPLVEIESLLWAEAKKGASDIIGSFVQLILTIGKARTFDKFLPPPFLGALDGEKIAFIPYNEIQELFYVNDFNWNVAPSNHETKEFKLIYEKIVGLDNSPPFLEGWTRSGRGGKEGCTPKGCGVVVNHWIPFTELEVGARTRFDSSFMTDFMTGKIEPTDIVSEKPILYLFSRIDEGGGGGVGVENLRPENTPCLFSETAQNVFNAGRALWQYYHNGNFSFVIPNAVRKLDNIKYAYSADAEGGRGYNVNASLYDIREHFQGRNEKGVMNNKSNDETYNELMDNLRLALKELEKKIEPKIYEYGFLFY